MPMSKSKMMPLLLLALLSVAVVAAKNDAKQAPPNIIFILAEDMGWGDLPVYGHPYARMPNCDRLAREGMKMNRFYVTGTTCNPSRTGLMTGRHPAEFPSYPADYGIPEGIPTVTKLLRDEAGYRTGHVGKWHLGPEDLGDQYGIDYVRVIGPTHKDPRGRDSAVFGAALDFIADSQNDGRPFYLNIWSHVAHSPVKPPQHLVDIFADVTVDRSDFDDHMQHKFDEAEALGGDIDDGMRNYLADLYALDMQIGWILDKLDRLGLAENTVLAFSADHGAAPVLEDSQSHPTNMMGYAGGLRGGKHDFFEGGLREPFLIRWPSQVPAGVTSDSVVWAMDWLPTVASMAGITIDESRFEGEDVTDIFTGTSDRSRYNPLVWKFPHKNIDSKMVMLYDDWKFHMWKATGDKKEHKVLLYDLKEDPGEDYDLHEERADIAFTLSKAMIEWETHLPMEYAMKNDDPLPFDVSANPYIVKPPFVLQESNSEEEYAVATPDPTATPTTLPTDAPITAELTTSPTDAPVTSEPTQSPASTPAGDLQASTTTTFTYSSTSTTCGPTVTYAKAGTYKMKYCASSKFVNNAANLCYRPLWGQPTDGLKVWDVCCEQCSVYRRSDADADDTGELSLAVSLAPTNAPVSSAPTKAPVSPAPTNAPVSPAPTNAPVSPPPTRDPTSTPRYLPTSTPKTCEATGSSCGEAHLFPCCPGDQCTHVHGLGKKCLRNNSVTSAPIVIVRHHTAASPAATVTPTAAPTDAVCEATGRSCGDTDSLPCCPGDQCVHIHGLGKKCLWVKPPSTSSSAPTTVAHKSRPGEEDQSHVGMMIFVSQSKSPTAAPTARPTLIPWDPNPKAQCGAQAGGALCPHPAFCCSATGFCGLGKHYCSRGCQSGPLCANPASVRVHANGGE